jgi:predicted dehydrogenase
MTTLKVGMIGLGGISHLHLGGWKAAEYAEVIAGCDINPAVFARWSHDYGVKKLTTDPAEVIGDPQLDIIDICTPNNYHAPLAIAALEAGKHVLCEKPLAPTPAEIHQMIDARNQSGKLLMTGQHFRFTGAAKALKAEIDTGVLGNVYHARAWWLRRNGVPTTPGFILKQHSSGGASVDIGVHVLDLMLWFMGHPRPVSVAGVARAELVRQPGAFSAWAGPIPPEFDVEEFAAAFIRFDNGASAILEASWLLHHDTSEGESQVWLYGDRAGSRWPKCEIYESNNTTRQLYNRTLQLTPEKLKPHHQECVEFVQAIVSGAPSPVPPEQSLQVAMILDAIYRSQQSGREALISE